MAVFLVIFVWLLFFIFLCRVKLPTAGISSFILFTVALLAEKLTFGLITVGGVMFYSSLCMGIGCIMGFWFQAWGKSSRKSAAAAGIVNAFIFAFFLLFPSLFVMYTLSTGLPVSDVALFAVFQSNGGESTEFVSEFISYKHLLIFSIIFSGMAILLVKQGLKSFPRSKTKCWCFFSCGVLLFTLSWFFSADFRLYQFVKKCVGTYREELQLFKETQAKWKSGEIEFKATKDEQGEVYVIVIGESANKHHMAIYGYLRNTTPRLSAMQKQGTLLVFDNVFPPHTHTIQVLSLSLTEANQVNTYEYFTSPSIINMLNKAEFETYWITNQVLKGAWDNWVSVMAHDADHLIGLNAAVGRRFDMQVFDEATVATLNNVLKKDSGSKNKAVFIHLMGSHLSYKRRYPATFETFDNSDFTAGRFGARSASKERIASVNTYDNSILYNDYVVSSIIERVRSLDKVSGVWYVADHADDVWEMRGHNADFFSYSMTQLPMVVWLSDKYKHLYPDISQAIRANQDKLYSNGFLYDSLIGWMGIHSDHYDKSYDITRSDYLLEAHKAYTLKRKLLYTAPENFFYQQKKNIGVLRKKNLCTRVIPHRVNSVGKLSKILFEGWKSLEVDVLFNEAPGCFQVGHDESALSELSLEDFLKEADKRSRIEKIWIDWKNLNQANSLKALERLEYLDHQFAIKQKAILETSALPYVKEFSDKGYHTSYYLPTNKIFRLLDQKNDKDMLLLADEMAISVEQKGLKAVSFDSRLYPFVKDFLEEKLPPAIVYHTWFLDSSTGNPACIDTLIDQPFFKDERVKTILLPYKSAFTF